MRIRNATSVALNTLRAAFVKSPSPNFRLQGPILLDEVERLRRRVVELERGINYGKMALDMARRDRLRERETYERLLGMRRAAA